MNLPTVELKAKRNSLHPWIYQRMIRRPKHKLAPGSLVEIMSKEGRFIGRGIYNEKSTIGLRLLTENPSQPLDAAFFADRIREATVLRRDTLRLEEEADCYRIIHGEADGFPGLIVDRFAEVIVVEPYSAGYRGITLDWIARGLAMAFPGTTVMARPDDRTKKREGYGFQKEIEAYPGPSEVTIQENGVRMKVDLRKGHKTGFFLDQRDNRRALAELTRGKRVLDCCCYTGGFSIAAALKGATEVSAIDLDEDAISVARNNAELNDVSVDIRQQDVFDALRQIGNTGDDRPDVVVLDPPKYANIKEELNRARRMYGDLNRLGLQAVKPGGILLTCSCSGLVSDSEFVSIVTRAAAEAGVQLQIFRTSGAAPDHPFSTTFLEGRYLKALFGRVIPLFRTA